MVHSDRWQYIKACWECNTTPRQDVLEQMKKEEDKCRQKEEIANNWTKIGML